MNFNVYDIMSHLVPGFALFTIGMTIYNYPIDKDLMLPYTSIAFIIGYFVNTLSSWFEQPLFFLWGGEPSLNILEGKSIWKVKFYESEKAMELLKEECSSSSPSNDQLFSIAVRYASTDTRVSHFNTSYAFSRVILTTIFISSIFVIAHDYSSLPAWFVTFTLLFCSSLRCKQRAYYYAREILNVYLRIKNTEIK